MILRLKPWHGFAGMNKSGWLRFLPEKGPDPADRPELPLPVVESFRLYRSVIFYGCKAVPGMSVDLSSHFSDKATAGKTR
ncbi:unnamed protein product [Sphagnum tenellum]